MSVSCLEIKEQKLEGMWNQRKVIDFEVSNARVGTINRGEAWGDQHIVIKLFVLRVSV